MLCNCYHDIEMSFLTKPTFGKFIFLSEFIIVNIESKINV